MFTNMSLFLKGIHEKGGVNQVDTALKHHCTIINISVFPDNVCGVICAICDRRAHPDILHKSS